MNLFDSRQLWLIGPKFRGPIFFSAGALLLVSQLVAWCTQGWLHSWLIGGGIGLILLGGAAWFFYLDDRQYSRQRGKELDSDDLPTADEYDALLESLDVKDDESGH